MGCQRKSVKLHKGKRKRLCLHMLAAALLLIVSLLGLPSFVLPVSAKEEASFPVRLIQTMSEQDEYEGLLHLGMLDAEVLDFEDVNLAYEAVKPCIVRIEAEGRLGSGIILELTEDKAVLVSNKHLLEYAKEDESVTVRITEKERVVGKVCYISEQYDIGFLEIPITRISISALRQIRQVSIDSLAYQNVEAGTQMFHIGSADGAVNKMYDGVVADAWKFFPEFHSFMIHSHCKGRPGMSGGGTFDAYGNLIGMISGGLGEETASIPLPLIKEEMSKIL